jgi:hypothetical protein
MHILHILHMSIFCILILHVLHINSKYAERNRALLDTHLISPTTTWVILSCTPPSSSGIHSTRVTCVSQRGLLCRGNCSKPIARTWCLSARLGYLMALFSSGWITYGSATFCSCSIHTKTDTGMQYHECAYVSVLEEYKVIFCIF